MGSAFEGLRSCSERLRTWLRQHPHSPPGYSGAALQSAGAEPRAASSPLRFLPRCSDLRHTAAWRHRAGCGPIRPAKSMPRSSTSSASPSSPKSKNPPNDILVSDPGGRDVHLAPKSDGVRAVSWLLGILWSIFGAFFDLAREIKRRDRSGPKWFRCSLFVALIAGSVAETDNLGAR